MTPTTERERRVLAVVATCCADLADEYTIIASIMQQYDDPELSAALQRCLWLTHGLAHYANRRGGRAQRCTWDRLILEDQAPARIGEQR